MAEQNTGTTTVTTSTEAPKTTETKDAKILGKFADYAALEKAYQEAEGKISEYGSKYKAYDKYEEKGGVSEVDKALDWARNMKAALDQGLLVPKGSQQTQSTQTTEPSLPWEADDWAFKSAGEQAKAITAYTQSEVKKYVDGLAGGYTKQISDLSASDAKQKSIMLKAIAKGMKAGMDPEEILEKAAAMGGKTPEELIDMVLDGQRNSPESQKAELEKQVASRVAEELQKREKDQFADVLTSKKPRFGPKNANREQENRSILESLQKQGIRLI